MDRTKRVLTTIGVAYTDTEEVPGVLEELVVEAAQGVMKNEKDLCLFVH